MGVDVEIRPHDCNAIDFHELSKCIQLVENSSTDPRTVERVKSMVSRDATIFVVLDPNHTNDHALKELNAYSVLVSVGTYIVACDGIMKILVGAQHSHAD